MRMRFVPRQLMAVVIASMLGGGCGYVDFFQHPRGVGVSSPNEIAAYFEETEKAAIVISTGRRLSAGEYLIASIGHTNERCHDFFDTLERFKDDNRLMNKVLTAAIAAGAPLLGLNAGGHAIAQYTSAISIASTINTDTADIYAFSTFREHLKSHVTDAMSSFRNRNGITTLTRGLVGLNDFTAVSGTGKVNPIDFRYKGPASCQAYETKTKVAKKTQIVLTGADETPEIDSCRLNGFLDSQEPVHVMVARNVATEYASLCSISNMKKIIVDAFNATETKVKGPDTSSTTTTGKEKGQAEAAAASAAKSEQLAQNAESEAKKAATDAGKAKSVADMANKNANDAKDLASGANSDPK
ncbi:MAG: hypothetical protein ABL893_08815 [Hyphomicrobium sp.]|nr:hypothetical protein [Hyphomicrobium sp.]